jgi:hypothetical protein
MNAAQRLERGKPLKLMALTSRRKFIRQNSVQGIDIDTLFMPLLLMGRLDEASALAAGQGIFPGGSFTAALFRKPEQRELFLSSLKVAAGEQS